jgi:hypothetical protein
MPAGVEISDSPVIGGNRSLRHFAFIIGGVVTLFARYRQKYNFAITRVNPTHGFITKLNCISYGLYVLSLKGMAHGSQADLLAPTPWGWVKESASSILLVLSEYCYKDNAANFN